MISPHSLIFLFPRLYGMKISQEHDEIKRFDHLKWFKSFDQSKFPRMHTSLKKENLKCFQ